MHEAKKHTASLAAIIGIVIAAILICVLYTVMTMSFPIKAVDSIIFRDVTIDYSKGIDDSGNASTQKRVWFWEQQPQLPHVMRDGYDLVGWQTSDGGKLIQAQWKLTVWTIDYDLDFGEIPTDKLDALAHEYTIETPAFELPAPTRYAYSFDGWTIDGARERVKRIDPAMLRGDTTIHANWKPAQTFTPATVYLGDFLIPVPYIYCIDAEEAPANCAGIWKGVGDVDDGKPTYILGHNPGVFTPVSTSFKVGSRFAVCDDNGKLGAYEVIDTVVILYEGTLWTRPLEAMTMPDGEYVSLQTCRGDKVFMDIYVAKRIDG